MLGQQCNANYYLVRNYCWQVNVGTTAICQSEPGDGMLSGLALNHVFKCTHPPQELYENRWVMTYLNIRLLNF